MATIDFSKIRVGDIISLHHTWRFQDTHIVGKITRLDKDYNRLCIDGFTYRNDRLERIEFWFMDYAYVRKSQPVTPEEYQLLEDIHRQKPMPESLKNKFFQ